MYNRDSRVYRAAFTSAVIAGAFCLTVLAAMVVDEVRMSRLDPLNSPELLAMRKKLTAEPNNEQLKKEIRSADQRVRQQFAASQVRSEMGRYLLLVGIAVVLLSGGLAVAAKKRPALPPKAGLVPAADAGVGGGSVRGLWFLGGFVAILAVAAFVSVQMSGGSAWMTKPTAAANAAAENLPGEQELARNWPMFRGPGGLGFSSAKNVPTHWDGKTGEGVLWKVPVSLPGRSSPIIWGNRVFVTGATRDARAVFCFDAGDGKLLWQRAVSAKASGQGGEPSEFTGFAASTPATDGLRVYAMFANGDIAAFDLAGKQLWSRNLGFPDSTYGLSASLAAWRGRVIVQYDQGDASDKKSSLIAIDGATGQNAWVVARPVDASWTSPILIDVDGQEQLVTSANPCTIAYDPSDGAELWRGESALGRDLATSPAFAGGVVMVASKADSSVQKSIVGISTGGAAGPAGHIVWTGEKVDADVPSPLGIAGGFLTIHSTGDAVYCDAKDGKEVWRQKVIETGDIYSSPVVADGRVYIFDRLGNCIILKAGREFAYVGTCPLGEACETVPAFLDGKIIVRGEKNLYCAGTGKASLGGVARRPSVAAASGGVGQGWPPPITDGTSGRANER
jgi:outer membrane protein assembly factor BamB